jgi:hypothetical protein
VQQSVKSQILGIILVPKQPQPMGITTQAQLPLA